MKVQQITDILEELAPRQHAEDFDNTGLLLGRPDQEVKGVLIALDCTEAVIQEALDGGANMIVSFHPIIFKGLTHINGSTYVERVVMSALRHEIALYSLHTALDNSARGVSARMASMLGLRNTRILIPRRDQLLKLSTYVPFDSLDSVRSALFAAGAGALGHYRECSFELQGIGGFLPLEQARPALGSAGSRHLEPETQLNVVLDRSREGAVVRALKSAHPYEEVAFELVALRNERSDLGMGVVGRLDPPLAERAFLEQLKQVFGTPLVRHSELLGRPVERVAVLGGSGSFAIPAARQAGCQVLVTADLKYHDFFQAEGDLWLTDIGHFESEQFTKNLLHEYLTEKMPNFAVTLSKTRTNPVFYY